MSLKPEFFGKYILLDKIAMGGMAEVYRAKTPGAEGIGKIIAIKRILPQFSANHEFIEMFKSEAKIAINLAQGNIAQIYEFGEEQKLFFLAMEYIEGRNLRQILTRCTKLQKALTIEQCVYIIAQVANGLDHAHRCTNKNTGTTLNLIHRDMSPQNIMVSFDGEIKIIDFGIAKAESKIETTRAGILKGKFGYMSPEQAEGLDLDSRTDIFSTGIVLWELLSGERLFVAHNEVNTIRKIRECQIPSLRKVNPNVHEELERITAKALAKDRSLRYQNAADLYRDLSRFLYKVNPEFTPHELVLFTKSLFKEDILEDRKLVMEFAKINFPSKHLINPEHTQSSTNASGTFTETSDQSNLSGFNPKSGSIPNDVNEGPPSDLHIDSKEIKAADAIPFNIKIDRIDILRQVHSGIGSGNNNTGSKSVTALSGRPNSFGQSRSALNTAYPSNETNEYSLFKSVPKYLILASILIGTVLGIKYQDQLLLVGTRLIGRVVEHTNLTSTSPETLKPVPVPLSIEKSRVFVHSNPAGADILVDGELKGSTPAEIIISQQTKVSIAINRDGYAPYKSDFVATRELEDIGATLLKASTGYLNIDATPANSDIFINGVRIIDTRTLGKYPVQAGTQIKIKAVNPYTNASDEVLVSVKQDTIKTIKLFPRKSK